MSAIYQNQQLGKLRRQGRHRRCCEIAAALRYIESDDALQDGWKITLSPHAWKAQIFAAPLAEKVIAASTAKTVVTLHDSDLP